MLKLDHLTVIAPTLGEGVSHVRDCLDIDVPFGTRHLYMGTHNHRLRLGDAVYLEIVALDPEGVSPGRPRWFGVDDRDTVRSDWEDGRRLRGWVASTVDIDRQLADHPGVFGERVALPFDKPSFNFSIPADGSLPLDGAAPSLIDHRDDLAFLANIPDLGARLRSVTLEHPEATAIAALYKQLAIDRPPEVMPGSRVRYRAMIETPGGLRALT
ncbi:MAG: VOC family protein [Pseudomonadota bacterium]